MASALNVLTEEFESIASTDAVKQLYAVHKPRKPPYQSSEHACRVLLEHKTDDYVVWGVGKYLLMLRLKDLDGKIDLSSYAHLNGDARLIRVGDFISNYKLDRDMYANKKKADIGIKQSTSIETKKKKDTESSGTANDDSSKTATASVTDSVANKRKAAVSIKQSISIERKKKAKADATDPMDTESSDTAHYKSSKSAIASATNSVADDATTADAAASGATSEMEW